MEHSPYQKIEESTQRWGLTPAQQRTLDRAQWLVTEKIHGANICFIYDGEVLQIAKRKSVLAQGEAFFNVQRVVARLRRAISALHGQLYHDGAQGVLWLYGELYGGEYPGMEAPQGQALSAVQTGVWYSPDLEFCAFDLGLSRAHDEAPTFMGWLEAMPLIEAQGIMAAQPLLVGDFSQVIAYPTAFESTIPARHQLPPLGAPNVAEGVVLRPAHEIVLQTEAGALRPLLKRKNPQFAEDERYHQAQASGEAGLPDEPLAMLEWYMAKMLNPNRLAAATSKLGVARSDAERRALGALVAEDVWEDLERWHGALLETLEQEERALLRAALDDDAMALAMAR